MFEKIDKTDLKVLKFISERPYKKFYLRQISRELKISPSSVKKAIDKFLNLNLLKTEKVGNLRIIFGNMDEQLLKQYKILENISLLKELLQTFPPAISTTLYGSFATGENDNTSDIDLFVLTNTKKYKYPSEYKNHQVQLKIATPAEWNKIKKENKTYAQELIKGINLHGEKIR